MNIVFLDSYTVNPGDVDTSIFEQLGNYTSYDFTTQSQIPERVADADIIIVNKHLVNVDLLLNAPKLKYVIVAATGYNNLDTKALISKNIPASNVKGYSTDGVAQYVMACLHHHFNKINFYHQEVEKGRWQKTRDFCFFDHTFQDLANINLGIIGFGTIGKRVAELAHAYGTKIIVHTKYPIEGKYNFVENVSLEEIYKNADVITLHAPLNESKTHMINETSLSQMKNNAVLINTGRGGLIEELALKNHHENNPYFTSYLDVLKTEPPVEGNAVLALKNCNITPHIAWSSKQSREKLIIGIAENIKHFIEGTPINRIV
jgi:glycerate dehydrogenase